MPYISNFQNIEAERAVILCLLDGDPGVARIVFNSTNMHDFTSVQWRDVYTICKQLHEDGSSVTRTAVMIEVERLTNSKYVRTWVESAESGSKPDAFEVEKYCSLISEARKRNELSRFFMERQAQLTDKAPETIISESQALLSQLAQQGADSGHTVSDIGSLVSEIAKDATDGQPRSLWGLPTGFCGVALDDLTGGIQPSHLWILTGTTGMGKSMLALSMVLGFHRENPKAGRPLIISTEMYPHAIIRRLLAITAGVPLTGLLRRNLDTRGKQAVRDADREKLLDGIAIAYMPGRSVDYVFQYALQHKRQYGLPLMLIDLMEGLKGGDAKDEYTQLTQVCRSINERKGELSTCIMGVVQQNAVGYAQGTERGAQDILACIKGTGQFRQDADKVLGLVRKDNGHTEIWQAKDRDPGTIGKITVEWLAGRSGYRLVEDDDSRGSSAIPTWGKTAPSAYRS